MTETYTDEVLYSLRNTFMDVEEAFVDKIEDNTATMEDVAQWAAARKAVMEYTAAYLQHIHITIGATEGANNGD